MARKRLWVVVLIVLIAASALTVFYKTRGKKRGATYRTELVQRGDVRVTVSATGTLQAVTTVQVGSQVSGTILRLYADFNDRVKEGQILAQLDPTFLEAQMAQSQADLNKTEVQVRQALRDSARVFPLGSQGLASKAELDAAQTALDAARAGAASSKAALDRARTNLHYATILSPIDGVVISRNVDVGQTVAASLSAPTLFTIANDLTQMQLEASVDEADIGLIRENQKATFTVDAYPDRSFTGEIHQIRLSPTMLQNVVTYSVIIYVQNPDQKLLPGMTANVTIQVDEAKDVFKVPSLALRFRPLGSGGATGGWPGAAVGAASGAPSTARPGGRPDGGPGAATSERRGPGRSEGAGGVGTHSGEDGSSFDSPRVARGTLYLLSSSGAIKPLRVRVGLTDGTFTAVYGDSLREGEPVVIALDSTPGSTPQQGQVNPFAPRMPGGGRR